MNILELQREVIDLIYKRTGILVPASRFASIMQSLQARQDIEQRLSEARSKLTGTGYVLVKQSDLNFLRNTGHMLLPLRNELEKSA